MRYSKKILFILVLLFTGIGLSGCSNSGDQSKNDKNIVEVGAILPLTGPAAIYGQQVKSGQQKAVKYLNDEVLENKSVEMVYADGKGDPAESVNAYMKLRNEGINIFTTTMSSVSLALKPKAQSDQAILFADAAHPDITSPSSKFIFRHSNTTTQESEKIIEYIKDKTPDRVALINLNDAYGQAAVQPVAQYLKETSNFELVLNENYEKDQNDFNTLINKLRGAEPDLTVLIGYGQSMGLIVSKIRELNVNSDILASIGFIITGADEVAGDAANGLDYVTFDFENTGQFQDSNEIKPFEVLGYSTVVLLGHAIQEVGDKPQKIVSYISDLKTFKTRVEQMTISESNDILPNLRIESY